MEKIIISLKDGNVKEFEIPVESNVHCQYRKRGKAHTLLFTRNLLDEDLSYDDNTTFLEKVRDFMDDNEDNIDSVSWCINNFMKSISITSSSYIEYSIDSMSGDHREGAETIVCSTVMNRVLDGIKVV